MKGEGDDSPEDLGRDEPERRRRSASGRQHPSQLFEVSARVVGERARLHHAQQVCVPRFGGKRGTGGEQDGIDTSHDSQPLDIPTETPFSLRNCEI